MKQHLVLQLHLVVPATVERDQLLLCRQAVIKDTEDVLLACDLLQFLNPVSTRLAGRFGCGRTGYRRLGLGGQPRMVRGERGNIRSCQLVRLIDELHAGALRRPLRNLAGQGLVLPGRDDSCLAIAADRRLLVILLHRRLAGG